MQITKLLVLNEGASYENLLNELILIINKELSSGIIATA